MQQGWVSIHRSIKDNFVWQDKPFNMGAAWIDLILMANHEEKKMPLDGQLIIIRRGQTFTSVRSLAEKWGWSKVKVSRYLALLEQDDMVKLERSKSGTLLTLVNYDNYQDCRDDKRTPSGHRADTERTIKRHRADDKRTISGQNNNDNNENNVNNENNENNENNVNNTIPLYPPSGETRKYFPNDELLEDTFREFIKMRKKIRKPMTEKAIDLMLKKLEKLSPDPLTQVKILEQSISNSWSGIYELKEDRAGFAKSSDSMADKWGLGGMT